MLFDVLPETIGREALIAFAYFPIAEVPCLQGLLAFFAALTFVFLAKNGAFDEAGLGPDRP
jgi:hypothetical protein